MKTIIVLLISVCSLTIQAQTDPGSFKWKKFSKSLNTHIEWGENHFQEQLDLENRNEINGMPMDKEPLYGSASNFIETAAYVSYYRYSFETEADAKVFFEELGNILKKALGEDFQVNAGERDINAEHTNEAGDHCTVQAYMEGTNITISIQPPINKPIPY